MHKDRQPWSRGRKILIGLSIPVILIGLLLGVEDYKLERVRAEWKTAALGRLARLSAADEPIRKELETLRTRRGTGEWVGQNVLLMENDEYLIYAFRHGFNNGSVDHLFLALGSDGRWYYSTYHFCTNLTMAAFNDPSASIAEFAGEYFLREFDGKSDDCLKRTWPEK